MGAVEFAEEIYTMAARFGILARGLSTSASSQQLVKPPVQVYSLEGRYAAALYSAAHKKKALAAVEKDLKEFSSRRPELKSCNILKVEQTYFLAFCNKEKLIQHRGKNLKQKYELFVFIILLSLK